MFVPIMNVPMVVHVLKMTVLQNVIAQMASPEIIVERKVIFVNMTNKYLFFKYNFIKIN